MSLLAVANMKPHERTARRLMDEQIHDRVESFIRAGVERRKSFSQTAGLMGCERRDVIASYWRHRRRNG